MKSSNLKKIIVLSWLLLGVVVLSEFSPSPKQRPENQSKHIITASTTKLHSTEYFDFKLGSFRFIKEKGWEIVSPESIVLPKGLKGTQFALKKKGTSCVFAYLFTPYNSEYQQTLSGDRVFTVDGQQLDFWWHTHKDYLPKAFQYSHETRGHYAHEVDMVHYPTFSGNWMTGTSHLFVLFNESGKIVSDKCTGEAMAMLTSLQDKYDQMTINADSQGVLYFATDSQQIGHLFFNQAKDPISKVVMDIKVDSVPGPIVYKDMIYYVAEGRFKTLSPISQEVKDLPVALSSSENEIINEFYIYKDRLFYLFGKSCIEYLNQCSLRLYEYDLMAQTNLFLVDGIHSRDIVGYDPERDILAMMWRDGDAGCSWSSAQVYDFRKKELSAIGSYDYCDGDVDKNIKMQEYNLFLKPFHGQVVSTSYISINKGKLMPFLEKFSSRASPMFLRYVY